jgi:hypothetical protein
LMLDAGRVEVSIIGSFLARVGRSSRGWLAAREALGGRRGARAGLKRALLINDTTWLGDNLAATPYCYF